MSDDNFPVPLPAAAVAAGTLRPEEIVHEALSVSIKIKEMPDDIPNLFDGIFVTSFNVKDSEPLKGEDKELPKQIWQTESIGHQFRRLLLAYPLINKSPALRTRKFDMDYWTTVISQVSPHIETLELKGMPPTNFGVPDPSEPTDEEVANFIRGFTNLKLLVIEYGDFWSFCLNIGQNLDKYEVMLNALDPRKTNVKFQVNESCLKRFEREGYPRFGSRGNVSWILELKSHSLDFLDELERIMTQYGSGNVKFDISGVHIEEPGEFKKFVAICCKDFRQELVEGIKMSMDLDQTWGGAGPIRNLLGQLRPSLVELELCNGAPNQFMDILSPGEIWPKLSKLSISSYNSNSFLYNHPLEILKFTPKLKKLKLNINENAAIFHNIAQSDQASLKEYFGHLVELAELKLVRGDRRGRGANTRIERGGIREGYLKELLPAGVQIKYSTC